MRLRARGTILVVEDEPAVRRLASRVLAGAGYQVIEVEDGAAALDAWEKHRGEIALILLDVVMPGVSGREVASRIHGRDLELPILFTSGYATEQLQDKDGEEHFELISKPYRATELRQRIRALLDA